MILNCLVGRERTFIKVARVYISDQTVKRVLNWTKKLNFVSKLSLKTCSPAELEEQERIKREQRVRWWGVSAWLRFLTRDHLNGWPAEEVIISKSWRSPLGLSSAGPVTPPLWFPSWPLRRQMFPRLRRLSACSWSFHSALLPCTIIQHHHQTLATLRLSQHATTCIDIVIKKWRVTHVTLCVTSINTSPCRQYSNIF